MKQPSRDWYKRIWSLDIQDMSWVEHAEQELDFIIDVMDLSRKGCWTRRAALAGTH